MKILSVTLNNYIGIYNGLGLNNLYIDFRKCKYRTIVIKGKNGSGKSTLSKAIHPLPDNNSSLIPKLTAEKILEILDNDILYSIRIVHGIDKHGNRETTKAYISKTIHGETEELNPNGNITSYKETLFTEFNLDPNFVSLSQLSSEDRGLADKTPVERKKFVNSIINTLQVYNDMYKTLSKRSSVFKSMINNLISKIDNIGEEEKLELTLLSLENRINSMMDNKDAIISDLASNKSKISLIDPDGSIQVSYDNIYNNLISINNTDKELQDKINIYLNKIPDILDDYNNSTITSYHNSLVKLVNDTDTSIRLAEGEINSLLNSREEEAKSIQTKSSKLLSLQSNRNYKDLSVMLKDTRECISEYKSILDNIGIVDINAISKDEFIIGLNTLKEIKDSIDVCKSFYDHDVIEKTIECIYNNSYPDTLSIKSEIDNLNRSISENSILYQQFVVLKNISTKLELRPGNCKINTCNFIKDAVDAESQEPEKNMAILDEDIREKSILLKNRKEERDFSNSVIECINYVKSMLRNIDKNISIINKLPIGDIILNRGVMLKAILDNYQFSELDKMYEHIEHANIIEDYKIMCRQLSELESEYRVYETKMGIINELTSDIDTLNTRLNDITTKIENNNLSILDLKRVLSIYRDRSDNCEILIGLVSNRKVISDKKNEEISKFNNIKNNMIMIKECAGNISILESRLESINKDIIPVINDRDKIKHGLVLLKEYNEELAVYTAKYSKIETIKKHSSPSKGIQTLFMELYMNKTTVLANQLLALLFEGEYVLGQFVINETEFRIPCIGGGIANDDISSMSTSQICMISMILSFVMLQQSSSKYNILKLDEIDGGLDTANRLQFLYILEQQIQLLNTEQVFIVSHNSEMDYSNCDIIQLKMVDNDSVEEGNIIYRY